MCHNLGIAVKEQFSGVNSLLPPSLETGSLFLFQLGCCTPGSGDPTLHGILTNYFQFSSQNPTEITLWKQLLWKDKKDGQSWAKRPWACVRQIRAKSANFEYHGDMQEGMEALASITSPGRQPSHLSQAAPAGKYPETCSPRESLPLSFPQTPWVQLVLAHTL